MLLDLRPKPPHTKFQTVETTLFLLCGSYIYSKCLRGGVAVRTVSLHKHSSLYSKASLVVKCANQHKRALSLQRWLLRPLPLGSFPEMISEAAAISRSPCGLLGCVGCSCRPSGIGSTQVNAEGTALCEQ